MKILCTLGPATLNKKFLLLAKKIGIGVVRLNMSHIKIENLTKYIELIRKHTNVPICIDSEGSQIRTGDFKKPIYFKKGKLITFHKKKIKSKDLSFYPDIVFQKLKVNDLLTIDFNSALVKIIYKSDKIIKTIVLNSGIVSGNKAVTLNRHIDLPGLTKKDILAFKIGKRLKIKKYAISFVRNEKDIEFARQLVPKNSEIISKIETFKALTNLIKITKSTDVILIDRGDLSRQVPLSSIPSWQKIISRVVKKYKSKLYIATNLLETMINSKNPTRAEINDIYNCISDGADGLVLAAETAIGKYPIEAVKMIKTNILNYKINHKNEKVKLNQISLNKIINLNKKVFLNKFR